jgi:hypothetical protein
MLKFKCTKTKILNQNRFVQEEVEVYFLKVADEILADFQNIFLPDFKGVFRGQILVFREDFNNWIDRMTKRYFVEQIDGAVCVEGRDGEFVNLFSE